MRLLFLTLLLTNLFMLGYVVYSERRAPAQADIVLLQINPDKIRLLQRESPSQLTGSASNAHTIKRAEPAPVSCVRWGTFAPRDSRDAAAALQRLHLGSNISQREVANEYWVFIPPLGSKADAIVEAARLKKIGITDLYIMREGKWNLAISLGVFRKKEQAEQRLTELKDRGVVAAMLGPRGATRVEFIIRIPNDAVAATLSDLQSEFPGTEWVSVSCDA